MRRYRMAFLALLIALAGTLPLLAMVEGQTPRLPHLFWGAVILTSQGTLVPAPVGTEVMAQVDGVERGRISVTVDGKYGSANDPKLVVQGDMPEGATIEFMVRLPNSGNWIAADQTVPFTSGAVTQLNLTVGQSPAGSLTTVGFASASSGGAESVSPASLPVMLSAASERAITVQYAATGGTATGSGVDYTLLGTGELTFAPGDTSRTISISIVDDVLVEGNETIVVRLSNPTNTTLGGAAVHTYTIQDNDMGISLAPALAVNLINTAHTVTATVTGTGAQPRPGVLVDFAIISGPNTGAATGSGPTDLLGRRAFTYTGAGGAGSDRIQACVNDPAFDRTCAQATKQWVVPPPTLPAIVLAPATATNQTGTSHTVTATVTGAGGQPLQDVLVRFKVISGPNEDQVSNPDAGECSVRSNCTTDASGRVSWTYASDGRPGTDGIVACFAEAGRQFCSRFSQVVTKEWVAAPQPEPVNILLSPLTATNRVGTAHTVTATVTSASGQPVQSVAVHFRVTSGPHVGITGSRTTDAAGKARLTYTGNSAGRDTIVARFVDPAGNTHTSNQVTKDWTTPPGPEPGPLEITLSPQSGTNRVGTDHTVTARITGTDDRPIRGVLVSFAVASGPNSGQVSNPNAGECASRNNCTTDARGRVSWTYAGTGGTGADTIVARFVDDEGNTRSSNRVQKTWVVSNQAPNCSNAYPSREVLSPPDGQFVRIDVLGVTDPDGDRVRLRIDSIWQDEPVTGPGSGTTAPDGRGVGGSTAGVRAERDGSGNGRVYHIRFTATDRQGGTCSGEVLVRVPHDQGNGKGGTAVDDGALYDSTVTRTGSGNSIGANSCRGEDSCRGRNLIVGENSCNGEGACNGNNSTIGNNSCNDEDACRGNRNTIGNRSCNGEEACRGHNNSIGDGSCNEEEACRGNRLTIGDGRCNEEEACRRGEHDDDGDDDDRDDDDGDDEGDDDSQGADNANNGSDATEKACPQGEDDDHSQAADNGNGSAAGHNGIQGDDSSSASKDEEDCPQGGDNGSQGDSSSNASGNKKKNNGKSNGRNRDRDDDDD